MTVRRILGGGLHAIILFAFISPIAVAQTVISIPPDELPEFLAPGTTINVMEGGVIERSTVNPLGGNRAVQINVLGGHVGVNQFKNVEFNLHEGVVSSRAQFDDSTVNVTGGRLSNYFGFFGSDLNITGGEFGSFMEIGSSSVVASVATLGWALDVADSEFEVTSGVLDSHADFRDTTFAATDSTIGSFFKAQGGATTAVRSNFGSITLQSTDFSSTDSTIGSTLTADNSSIYAENSVIQRAILESTSLVAAGSTFGRNLEAQHGTIEAVNSEFRNLRLSVESAVFRDSKLGSLSTNVATLVNTDALELSGGQVDLHSGVVDRYRLSELTLYGDEFFSHGQPVQFGDGDEVELLGDRDRGVALTGILSDGTSLGVSSGAGDFVQKFRLRKSVIPPLPAELNLRASGNVNANDIRPEQTLIVDAELTASNGLRSLGTVRLEPDGVMPRLKAFSGKVDVAGGRAGSIAVFPDTLGSQVAGEIEQLFVHGRHELQGGAIDSVLVSSSGELTVSGGIIRDNDSRSSASVSGSMTVTGGVVPQWIGLGEAGTVTLVGNNFFVNGESISLNDIGDAFVLPSDSVQMPFAIDGTLSDGSPLVSNIFQWRPEAQIRLQASQIPAALPAVIRSSTDVVPTGITARQTIRVDSSIQREMFLVGRDSSIIFEPPGRLDGSVRTTNAEVRFLGGELLGELRSHASEVSIQTDSYVEQLRDRDGHVSVFSGRIGTLAGEDSRLAISGGIVENIDSRQSTWDISGGAFGEIRTDHDSTIRFHGADFFLNGVEVLSSDIGDPTTILYHESDVLTGTLADGIPFSIFGIDYPNSRTQGLNIALSHADVSDATPGVIKATSEELPLGIRQGQQLVVESGDKVPSYFRAGPESVVTILGGEVGENFKAIGSTVTMHGGSFGDGFQAVSGGSIFIQNGKAGLGSVVGGRLKIEDSETGRVSVRNGGVVTLRSGKMASGSVLSGTLEMYEGSIEGRSTVRDSDVAIFGGELQNVKFTRSNLLMAGGTVGTTSIVELNNLTMLGGWLPEQIAGREKIAIAGMDSETKVQIRDGELHLVGSRFFQNSKFVPGLENPGDSIVFDLSAGQGEVNIAGTFMNGEDFAFEFGSCREDFCASLLRLSLGIEGDFDLDVEYSPGDVDILFQAVDASSTNALFDLTGDGELDEADVGRWFRLAGTIPGDTNLDGQVQFQDFLRLSSGFGQPGGWAQGDFDGDQLITLADFLAMSKNFSREGRLASVPEPSSTLLTLFAFGTIAVSCRRRTR